MADINVKRVEKRYNVDKLDQLETALGNLGFAQEEFSEHEMTLTYFCDTPELSIDLTDRIKIRAYVSSVPEKVDKAATYKLNFKAHDANGVSSKVSFNGPFDEMVTLAQERSGLPVKPLMATSYKRAHYLSDKLDFRVTVDTDVRFHKVEEDALSEYYQYPTIMVELKYDPDSAEAIALAEQLLSQVEHREAVSKKEDMYREYKKLS